MSEGLSFGNHDTDSDESSEADERQSSYKEQAETQAPEPERRSFTELLMDQQQVREETPPPPTGFLGGLEIAKNPLEDDEEDDDEDEEGANQSDAVEPESTEAVEEQPVAPEVAGAVQAAETAAEQEAEIAAADDARTEGQQPEASASNTINKDAIDEVSKKNVNPKDVTNTPPRGIPAETAEANNTLTEEVEVNDNKPEYAEPNYGKTPRTNLVEKPEPVEVNPDDLPANSVLTGAAVAAAATGAAAMARAGGNTPPGGGSTTANANAQPPSAANPNGPSATGSGGNTPPPPPGNTAPPPPTGGPGGRSRRRGRGNSPSGPSGGGTMNAYAAAAAGNVTPTVLGGNTVRTVERWRTNPGTVLAAAALGYLLGARKTNQLRRDAERTRDDFNKRMKEAEDQLAIQDREKRRSRILADEQQRTDAAAEQAQQYRAKLAESDAVTATEQQKVAVAAEQKPAGVIVNESKPASHQAELAAVPAFQRSTEQLHEERIAQREQVVRTRAIAQREADRLERVKAETIGVKPVPPTEHNLGPVEAAYANLNVDTGPSLEVPVEASAVAASSELRSAQPAERKPEKWEERAVEQKHERVGASQQLSAHGSGGQGSQTGSGGGQTPFAPSPAGLFSQVEAPDKSKIASGMTSVPSGQKQSYSKAITVGFGAGVAVLVLALIVYFIMR